MTSFSAASPPPDQTLHGLEMTVRDAATVLHGLCCDFQPSTSHTSQIPSTPCRWWPLPKCSPSQPLLDWLHAWSTCLVHASLSHPAAWPPFPGSREALAGSGAGLLLLARAGRSPWHMLTARLARGSSHLTGYKDRSCIWKIKSGLQAVQVSSRWSVVKGPPLHTGGTNRSCGISSPCEREHWGTWKWARS